MPISDHVDPANHKNELPSGVSAAQMIWRSRLAVMTLFVIYGVTVITFLSRLVKIREDLGNLSPAAVGYLLLACSLGDIVFSPICGAILNRVSLRRVIHYSGSLLGMLLIAIAIMTERGAYYGDMALAFMLGGALGAMNVAMNMAGVATERLAGSVLLPWFHAFFCVGAVIATTISHFTVTRHLGIFTQFAAIGMVAALGFNCAARYVCEFRAEASPAKSASGGGIFRQFDRALGFAILLLMATSLAEGSGNDWIVLGAVEAFQLPESRALLALWLFLFCETAIRFGAAKLIAAFGAARCLRAGFAATLCGVTLFVFAPSANWLWLATGLWGAGVSLGYPLSISFAAMGENSSLRASLAASLGAIMNIAAPPAIGLLANHTGIRHALLVLLIPIAAGLALLFFSPLAQKFPKRAA